jgi:putative peptide zinc metalloprotease protein
MFIASVSTILFNANPLLRYDGYYILSDFLEIPNLRQKSMEYSLGLIKRHIFRVKEQQPLPPPGQRAWLLVYSIASGIYRIFIGVMIVVLVIFKVPVLGVLMALGGIITWAGVPVYKTAKYLALDPELHRKRGRATAFSLAVAAAIVLVVGVIPFRVYVRADGILEPNDRRVLTAKYDGFVSKIYAHDGQWLHKGDIILVAHNPQLEAEIKQYEAQWRETEAQRYNAISQSDMVAAQKAQSDGDSVLKALAKDKEYEDDLTVRAPIDGQLVAPDINQLQGAYLANGKTEIGMVATMDDLRVKADLDANDAELPMQLSLANVENQIRFAGDIKTVLHASSVHVFPGAVQEVNPALGPQGGGDIEMDPKDPHGTHPKVPQFLIEMKIDNRGEHGDRYIAGQRAYVRFTIGTKPLIWQWQRRFWQLIQVHDSGKWL